MIKVWAWSLLPQIWHLFSSVSDFSVNFPRVHWPYPWWPDDVIITHYLSPIQRKIWKTGEKSWNFLWIPREFSENFRRKITWLTSGIKMYNVLGSQRLKHLRRRFLVWVGSSRTHLPSEISPDFWRRADHMFWLFTPMMALLWGASTTSQKSRITKQNLIQILIIARRAQVTA